ncbi:hypothetical protein [Saccharomonospora cyanea]|uniref:Uncharacterized protein n=1 Tax=Saccharomonospora cyanea NA-134 TaxID=882082 RepID=H5XMM9_9PSEU|nr:hypothetical protein [Saccharomonospora cyanea]EHR61008.1 hypothetical protein SaccyDRAFT_2117 [Saccharomonospora cyanea NA-134]
MAEQRWVTLPDGRRVPVNRTKGRGAPVALAVGTAVALGASGGIGGFSTVGGSSGGSATLSAAESAVVRNIESHLPRAKRMARQGNSQSAWKQLRMRKGPERHENAVECVSFTFGQVQRFFLTTPCRSLERWQYPVTDEAGNTMLVAVSKVTMRRTSQARRFRRLIDEHGTGDIHPIAPLVPFTGHHYDSKTRGRSVVLAETEPLTGNPSAAVLQATAEAATAITP